MSTHNPEIPKQSQDGRNPLVLILGGAVLIAVQTVMVLAIIAILETTGNDQKPD